MRKRAGRPRNTKVWIRGPDEDGARSSNPCPRAAFNYSLACILCVSRSVVSDSFRRYGLQPSCHCLLQEIFLPQGSNSRLPHCRQIVHCRQILYGPSHQGNPGPPYGLVSSDNKKAGIKQLPSQSHIRLNKDTLRPRGPSPPVTCFDGGSQPVGSADVCTGLLHPKRLPSPPSPNLKKNACLLPHPLRGARDDQARLESGGRFKRPHTNHPTLRFLAGVDLGRAF